MVGREGLIKSIRDRMPQCDKSKGQSQNAILSILIGIEANIPRLLDYLTYLDDVIIINRRLITCIEDREKEKDRIFDLFINNWHGGTKKRINYQFQFGR